MEQKNKARANVRMAVFVVLSVHVVGLTAALLMQGCRRQEPETTMNTETNAETNAFVPPAFVENNLPTVETNQSAAATNTMGPTSYFPPPLTETNVAPLVPAAGAQEYTIQKGDKFATLAPKFGVTVKAIQEANPNVDPRKLQIGQKIQIPAPTAAPSKSAAGTAETNASGQQIYTVKSGDNLTKIAREFGTTVRALRSENNLTTDRIKVGDKLKIPASASAPAAGGQM